MAALTKGIYEAKQQFNSLVAKVEEDGESIVITKHGKPVAKLVPVDSDERRLSRQERAAQLLKVFGKTHQGLSMTKSDIVDIVRSDRARPVR